MEQTEIWKGIHGYEGKYEVSNLGRVRSLRLIGKSVNKLRPIPRILIQNRSPNGYMFVSLCKSGETRNYSVHRLVLKTFVKAIQNKPQACHLDGDKSNNVLSNLVWGSQLDNESHKIAQGKLAHGERQGSSKLTIDQVLYIRNSHERPGVLKKMFGVSGDTILQIRRGKAWKRALAEFERGEP